MTENNKRAKELREALDGPKGALDYYLEIYGESEIKADILALIGDTTKKREHFAGLAMQGWLANKERPQHFHQKDDMAYCVAIADALIAELSKESP